MSEKGSMRGVWSALDEADIALSSKLCGLCAEERRLREWRSDRAAASVGAVESEEDVWS